MGADRPDYYWSTWKLAYCCKLKPIDGCPEDPESIDLLSGDNMRLYDQRRLPRAEPRPGPASAAGALPALCGAALLGLAAALGAGRSARALLGARAWWLDRRQPEPDEDPEPEGHHALLTGPSQ